MNIKRILICTILMFSFTQTYSQDLEEIMTLHYTSKNQEALSKVKNMHLISKVTRLGESIQVEIWQERPHKMRMEVLVSDQKTIQVYDGKQGYVIAPHYGITEAQEITGIQLQQLADQADIDGELYQWEEKGSLITLEGIETFGNKKVYILKVITGQGPEKKIYLDGETYLPIKMTSKYEENGKLVDGESNYLDYKATQEIMMPYTIENKINGFKSNTIRIQKIEFDIDIPENTFHKP